MNRKNGTANIKIAIGVLITLSIVVAIVAVVRLDVLGSKGGGLGKEFKYEVNELAYIDPNLILYALKVPVFFLILQLLLLLHIYLINLFYYQTHHQLLAYPHYLLSFQNHRLLL